MNSNQKIKNLMRLGWEEELHDIKAIKSINQSIIEDIKEERESSSITIHVIRHNDLDGIGVEVVFKLLSELYGIEVKYYEEPTNADYSFKNIVENRTPYDFIFIGDISFSSREFIDNILDSHIDLKDYMILLDHHRNVLWLNEYEFAYVKEHNIKDCIISSGSILTFLAFKNLLSSRLSNVQFSKLESLINYIAAYDTYFFKDNDELCTSLYGNYPNMLNILFKHNIKYKHSFIDNIFNRILDNTTFELFGNIDFTVSNIIAVQIDKLVDDAIDNCKIVSIDNRDVAIYYYSGEYNSEIGNGICSYYNNEDNRIIDYCILVDMNKNKCSLRTSNDDIDLTEIIKHIPGSGGHKKAAGFSFTKDIKFENNSMILN